MVTLLNNSFVPNVKQNNTKVMKTSTFTYYLNINWLEVRNSLNFCSTIVVDFFNRVNLIYGTISEYCDSSSCPTMSGGARFEYLWADGDKYKKPTALPAPQYVNLLMYWIENQINNETVFPASTGKQRE